MALRAFSFECFVFLLSELCHQCPVFVFILQCYHYYDNPAKPGNRQVINALLHVSGNNGLEKYFCSVFS